MKLATGLHEVLFRFGRDRRLQGFHVVLVHQAVNETGAPILKENGEVMLETITEPMTLDRAQAQGLQLSDSDGILSEALAEAILAAQTANARADELEAKLRALEAAGAPAHHDKLA
jgi:hypothetical protein